MLNECLKEEMINTSQSCHVLIVRNENKPNLELSLLICGKFTYILFPSRLGEGTSCRKIHDLAMESGLQKEMFKLIRS